jgi:anaerobic selenocysteine-containing dehydrogenase
MFARLARRMGFDDPHFTMSDEDALREALHWSHPSLEGITLDSLKETGWARLSIPSPDEYAPHAEGGFPTPSGRVELKASMAAGGDFVVSVFREGYDEHQSGAPVDPLPHWREPAEARSAAFPLTMISPKAHGFLNSTYGNADRQLRLMHERPQAILHPDDASPRGIAEGDHVTVRSERGELRALAQVSEDVAQGVVVCPMGYWLGSAEGGATVNSVTAHRFADLGRAPTFSDTAVEVAPVGG